VNVKIFFAGNFLSKTYSTRSVGEELTDQLVAKGYSVIAVSRYPDRLLRFVDFIISALKYSHQFDIAVIEVYSNLAFIWAEILVKLLRVQRKKIIQVLHGGGLVEFFEKNPRRVKTLFQSADRIVTPSNFLKEKFKIIQKDIEYIPNGIDIGVYQIIKKGSLKPNLTWLRAFHFIYNPGMAIQTVGLLQKHFPDVHLQMIGPDKKDGSKKEVLKLMDELTLNSNIELVGSVEKKNISEWLNKADIFINTTNYESFGVSVVEAAACGLPIVTTNVGELAYLWQHEEDALLVPPNDPEAMAAAVRRLLTEPGLAEHLSVNARKKAEQFDWGVILPQWEKLFEEVLSTHE